MSAQAELRKKFVSETSGDEQYQLMVKIVQKSTGTLETIVNSEKIDDEIKYILETYDDEFKMKRNPSISIVGYLLI